MAQLQRIVRVTLDLNRFLEVIQKSNEEMEETISHHKLFEEPNADKLFSYLPEELKSYIASLPKLSIIKITYIECGKPVAELIMEVEPDRPVEDPDADRPQPRADRRHG